MIDLRIETAELEQQIQELQPAFEAACMTLKIEKMAMERAIITRKFTPGVWTYSADILQQQDLVQELKRQFQLDHEPTGGRNITWIIKLASIRKHYCTVWVRSHVAMLDIPLPNSVVPCSNICPLSLGYKCLLLWSATVALILLLIVKQ